MAQFTAGALLAHKKYIVELVLTSCKKHISLLVGLKQYNDVTDDEARHIQQQ